MFKIKELEDFAVIEKLEDELELKDLTIFMGDNSSGKSYLAMLIHLFFRGEFPNGIISIVGDDFKVIKKIKSTIDKLSEYQNATTISLDLNDEELNEFRKIISDIFKFLAKDILNINIETIEIEYDINLLKSISFSYLHYMKANKLNHILSSLLYYIVYSHSSTSTYLPASRTGYLQTYKILANQAIMNSYSYKKEKDYMPLGETIREFISQLNYGTKFEENEFSKYIEKFILNGKVNIFQNNNAIDFELNNGTKVDINYLSSTVSELIPLVVFLKRGFIEESSLLIIEEPEAHLSFKNQKIMARLITMLVNHGIKVLITTHSDFLIYELNNLIMKDSISKKKELFKNDIKLDFNKVGLYNFLLKENARSVVSRVNIDRYGIDNKYIFDNIYSVTKEKNELLDLMDKIDENIQ